MALPVVHQSWRDVAFLHWRVDVDAVVALLPEELEPDLVDGSAWVSITPFRVERFRVAGLPPGPFASAFCETNVRTYVRNRDGVDGLWFLSLDVSEVLNAVGGRLVAAPYYLAEMSVDTDGPEGTVRYRARRRVGPAAGHDLVVAPGAPIGAGDETAALLAGRWRAFTRPGGVLLVVAVEHGRWPLHSAEAVQVDESLLAAAGLPVPTDEPLVHFADGVDARLGRPRPA